MAFGFSTKAIAKASARHPWRVVIAWIVLIVVSVGLISTFLSSATTTTADTAAHPDSKVGKTLLEQRLRGPSKAEETIVLRSENMTVDDPAYKTTVEGILSQVNALGPDIIESGTDYYQSQNEALVSQDRHATIIPITMTGSIDDATKNIEQVVEIVDAANGQNGFQVYVSGIASIGNDFNHAAENDIARGESIGGIIALIILLLVLGAVVAAVIPIVIAAMSIMVALAITAVIGQATHFSFFVTNMITMMGLAVGIDYCLFVISRFREERARGREVVDAVDMASNTAGRAVLFSGLTVIIALLGMLIVPSTIYRSVASGAIFVVAAAILASLTLLPAVLSLLGDNINRLGLPFVSKAQHAFDEQRPGGFWDRVASLTMRHPLISIVAVTVVLIAAAVPYKDINAGSAGVTTLPNSFDSKKGFELLAQDFSGGAVSPAEVVIDGNVNSPDVQAAVQKLSQSAEADPVFGPSTYTQNENGDLGLLSIQVAIDPYTSEADKGVERLRSDLIPAAFAGVNDTHVYVTGLTATNVDSLDITSHYTPIVLAFVLGLSFLLLTMVFRSIVVPAKAIVMNLLSVGAAYGLIVLVTQKGFLHNLFGFQQVDTVEFWLPLFLFSVLFGLSMDYHVFLLSRIRERYDQTNDNRDAVAFGVRSTGRLITGAALIMVAVFGGFAMGELVMLQQLGFGLGVSVLIDATIIRSILVPASMRMLGRWNWYLPSALGWLPHLGIEESSPEVSR